MSLYEIGLTWPFYLFIPHPPPPIPPPPVNHTVQGSQILWDGEGWTSPHTVRNTLSNAQWLLLSVPVFHRSFGPVIHKSSKCPFQAAHKHIIDLQKCHRTLRREPCALSPKRLSFLLSHWTSTFESAGHGRQVLVFFFIFFIFAQFKQLNKIQNHKRDKKEYHSAGRDTKPTRLIWSLHLCHI